MTNLGDKLKPCPFCGRKMVFYKHSYTNKHGKSIIEKYYMHEDYDIYHENTCVLDDINQPFTEDIDRKITVKEIAYDSDTTYIEKTRKTFLFLYEDNYVLHEPQKFINNNN